jgi:hypothetical protein
VIKPTFKADIVLGHIKIETFYRFRDGKMIGCGRATHYDKDGKIIKVVEDEYGHLYWS